MEYAEFLRNKTVRKSSEGFEPAGLNPSLFPWQREIVSRACRKGCYAIFADCGMGKTAMQLEWARQVAEHGGGSVLILAPLAVAAQTVEEGGKFGIAVEQVREMPESPRGVYVTNYEIMDRFDMAAFDGVVLDESSILKSFTGKTKRAILTACEQVRYRLSCTATPSPNDLMELLNQGEFLGQMKSNEALSVFFINDQSEAGKYRLKGHAAGEFWGWVASWCTAISTPSDMGYPDDGYRLPRIDEYDAVVDVADAADASEGTLFHVPNLNATQFHREKRRSLHERCEKVAEIVGEMLDEDGESVIVWCYLNDESAELKKLMPDAIEVRGSDSAESKEQAAIAFKNGGSRVLISKPSIFGFGMNFQACRNEVFCGLDYSFESYYQAVRRVYRFGQERDVRIVRVVGRDEKQILDAIQRKADMHEHERDSIASAVCAASGAFTVSEHKAAVPNIPFLKEEVA